MFNKFEDISRAYRPHLAIPCVLIQLCMLELSVGKGHQVILLYRRELQLWVECLMLREAIQYYSGCIVHRVCALESSSLQVVREAYSYVHKVLDTKSNITVLIGMIWLWIQEGGGGTAGAPCFRHLCTMTLQPSLYRYPASCYHWVTSSLALWICISISNLLSEVYLT